MGEVRTPGRGTTSDEKAVIEDTPDKGSAPLNGVLLNVNPTDGDTLVDGADTYEFVNAAVDLKVSNDSNIGVVIGIDAEATLASQLAAMNGSAVHPHDTLFKTDGVTPCAGIGTEKLLAFEFVPGSKFMLVGDATGIGGSLIHGPGRDLAFSSSLTSGATWLSTNLNLLGGHAAGVRRQSTIDITVTAAMVAFGSIFWQLPFTPSAIFPSARTSGGEVRDTATDQFSIVGDLLVVKIVGAGLAADDVLTVLVLE